MVFKYSLIFFVTLNLCPLMMRAYNSANHLVTANPDITQNLITFVQVRHHLT